MPSIEAQVHDALSALLGLPIRFVARAGSMGRVGFGRIEARASPKDGHPVDVPEYSLHLQCAWRVARASEVLFGGVDWLYPADEDADWDAFDPDRDESRLDSNSSRWLRSLPKPPKVTAVTADSLGGFVLSLDDGSSLSAYPDSSLRGEHSEHWRLFPGLDDSPPHFVVSGYGIDSD